MRRAAALGLALALMGMGATAGEIPRAVVVLERLGAGPEGEGAPPRFVLLEDGTVFVGGTSQVLTAKLAGGDLRALERRIADVRKLPGLQGTTTIGPGEVRHRLLLRRGRPLQITITGDPEQATALPPLAALLRDLPRFHHASLARYVPSQYALRARAGALAGGCRAWPFPDAPESVAFAPRVVSSPQVLGWPTGAAAASVCAGDKKYVVTLRPLLPGEGP
ncbi:MAG TPA: hypothetical protein VFO85_03745 [Vicinamibacteria bacterium]|nr:hypothetical protein [Vicinamibacteria bacterium]